jgi:hypothetical protein
MKTRSVPEEKDWGDYQSDLDRKSAHDLFAGHTNEQMRPYFRQNPIERTDDLRWMPEAAFRYYMLGFRDCLVDRDFDFLETSNAANCFLGLIIEKLEKQPEVIVPIMPELLPSVEHVARNQALYEAEESIYGNFLEKLAQIQALSAAHSKELI